MPGYLNERTTNQSSLAFSGGTMGKNSNEQKENMKAISTLLIAIGCLTVQLALADETNSPSPAAQPSSQNDVLNNDGVIQLKQLGLGDAVIVEKIKTSPCSFDVSINGLKQLKAANVSDDVIAAMLSAQSVASASAAAANTPAAPPADPNDPKSPHDAGIYYYQENGGKPTMTEMEPTVYTQVKSGMGLFMAYGQTVNQRAVLHPSHAMLQCSNSQPVFYFYFENTQSGLGETKDVATTPNEFVLAQFEVKDKDNLRSLIVGQINAYSGTQSGPKDQSVRPFDAQKIAPGVFKVSPTQGLADGEYCFFYGGDAASGAYGMGNNKVFDFGIQGSDVEAQTSEQTTSQSPKQSSHK
jgi:hypothetical protein